MDTRCELEFLNYIYRFLSTSATAMLVAKVWATVASARHNYASPPGILNSLKQFLLTAFLVGRCMETCCCAECRVVIVHRMTYFVVCVVREYFDVVGSLATTDSQNGPRVYETLVHLHSVSVCCVD